MNKSNIRYQSFCWVIGTTSFRTAKLNLKIEQQLILLNEFQNRYRELQPTWSWNRETQALYYDFLKEKGFVSGDAKRKDKDAREKTSGLVDIGLIDGDRKITQAGNELLNVAKVGDYREENFFNIDKDSYIYLKQILKTGLKIGPKLIRPYYILAKLLTELGHLTFDEFTYFLPLAVDQKSTKNIVKHIKRYREEKISIEDIIYDDLMDMENYREAYDVFLSEPLSRDLISLVGMNRKSRKYDIPYYDLLNNIIRVFYDGQEDKVYELFLAAKKISHRPGILWRNLLFKNTTANSIRKNGYGSINNQCVFKNCHTKEDIKRQFFKYMHVFKSMATLEDYFDLNKRYFNLTDTLIFDDSNVKFDLIPKYFFSNVIDTIFKEAFMENENLQNSVAMETISSGLKFDQDKIYKIISEDLGITIRTSKQIISYVKDERYRRFNELIDSKFQDETLIELLHYFESRDDAKIEKLITDEATIPTIFEYILGIIWYKISDREGDILDYMKLSLEPNLLPKTHATGGSADIIYEYEECHDYPRHSLLIEATLADGTNQRRMEMEPVSRHLGDFLLKSNNPFDYSLFISTFLHRNVVSDFRSRKYTQYYGSDDKSIEGMKIISLDTEALKSIIQNSINYKHLYHVFDKYHRSELKLPEWQDNLIREATSNY